MIADKVALAAVCSAADPIGEADQIGEQKARYQRAGPRMRLRFGHDKLTSGTCGDSLNSLCARGRM